MIPQMRKHVTTRPYEKSSGIIIIRFTPFFLDIYFNFKN